MRGPIVEPRHSRIDSAHLVANAATTTQELLDPKMVFGRPAGCGTYLYKGLVLARRPVNSFGLDRVRIALMQQDRSIIYMEF